ncbi:MAG: alpha-rhamnosidase, partial [Calditrichaeota bacterium]
QSMAGFLSMRASGPIGRRTMFVYGERLDADGLVDQDDIAGLVKSTPFQTDQYIFKGGEIEEWRPHFVYHGFRWVQVSGFPGKPSPEHFTANVVHTSFSTCGSFSCSNEMLNRIQQNTLWSFKSNFHGYPTDCPHREKNGWTGDAQLAAETGLFNFSAQSSYSKWIRDFGDEQQPNGEIPAIIPTGGWGYYWGNGPAWDSALILIPWYLYVYSGDEGILRNAYPSMKRYVDFLGTRAENHLVSWGLGDWCPARTEAPPVVTSTAYYYKDVSLLAQIAALLGQENDAAAYTTLAAEIRNRFNAAFFDSSSGNIADGSQTALACALYQGLVPEKHVDHVLALLIKKLQQSDLNFDCGILGTKYLFNVLTTLGKPELAYSRINSTAYPGWGFWLKKGATTLWESWDGSASRIHIMYGDVSAWFYKTLAGLRPDENQPGFKHFIIKPYFAPDLTWVKTDFDSQYGLISISWERQNDRLTLKVQVPVNTSASVYWPSTENVVTITNEQGLAIENMDAGSIENSHIVFKIGSGSYMFAAKESQ